MLKNILNTLKIIRLIVIIVFASHIGFAQNYNPVVQQIIDEIPIDSLIQIVKDLSGENEVIINGEPHKINSRMHNHIGNKLAESYLLERLKNSVLFAYSNCENEKNCSIICVKFGTTEPKKFVIIGAHFDSFNFEGDSPGANDNASGAAVVLEAARILNDYDFEYSIIFALWDEEEVGLNGSRFFAKEGIGDEMQINLVINLDMLAWAKENVFNTMIRMKKVGNYQELIDLAYNINSLYNIGLSFSEQFPTYYNTCDTDSFWQLGYPGISFLDSPMKYPDAYHSIWDKIDLFNFEYFLKNAKLAISYLAHSAKIINPTSVYEQQQFNNAIKIIPEPISENSMIQFNINDAQKLSMSLYNVLNQEVYSITDDYYEQGNHFIPLFKSKEIRGLQSGMYFIVARFEKNFTVKKILFIN